MPIAWFERRVSCERRAPYLPSWISAPPAAQPTSLRKLGLGNQMMRICAPAFLTLDPSLLSGRSF